MRFFISERKTYAILPQLPLEIQYTPWVACTCRILPATEESELHLVQTGRPSERYEEAHFAKHVDAPTLRYALEAIKTPEQARTFLTECGPWLPPSKSIEETPDEQYISWSAFKAWQEYFHLRSLGQHPRADTLPGLYSFPSGDRDHANISVFAPALGAFQARANGKPIPSAFIVSRCALETISAIVEAESMMDIEHRECSYSKCKKLFKVGFRKEKICCSDKCEHTVGQKRRRDALRDKRALNSGISKTTKAHKVSA